jgi:hypothetical protein
VDERTIFGEHQTAIAGRVNKAAERLVGMMVSFGVGLLVFKALRREFAPAA